MLQWEEVQVGKPGPGEARVRTTAVGLNYVDTYFRSGLYPSPLPSGIGSEGAGVVEEVGPGVTDIKPGDRVAYGNGPSGAYSEARVMPADRLVVLPDGISDQQAAAMMLKGMTTEYLIRKIHKVGKGDVILFHAAAGGVGLIACQWAKALGATVIGTVGNDEKAALAKAHGCDYPIVTTREDFVERVKEITDGEKLPVVYDSIGKDTFLQVARLPAPARHDGAVRAIVRPRRSGRSRHFRTEGLAVLHPPVAQQLRRQTHRHGRDGRGPVRGRALGPDENSDQPDLSAEGRRPGSSRPRKPQDHWFDGAHRLTRGKGCVSGALPRVARSRIAGSGKNSS